jgi:hypothetical protein
MTIGSISNCSNVLEPMDLDEDKQKFENFIIVVPFFLKSFFNTNNLFTSVLNKLQIRLNTQRFVFAARSIGQLHVASLYIHNKQRIQSYNRFPNS